MQDNFVTTTQWLAWLNYERQALEIFLNRTGWVTNLRTTQLISDNGSYTVAGDGYALTGVVMAVAGVYQYDQGTFRRLTLRPSVDVMSDSTEQQGTPYHYSLEQDGDDTVIRLHPRPDSGTFYAVWLPSPAAVTSMTGSMTYPLGFEEWLVLKLARRALVKEESDTSSVDKLIREIEQTVEELCWSRALAGDQFQRDVRQKVDRLNKNTLIQGVLLTGVELTTATILVPHFLGRPYRGFYVVDKTLAVDVFRDSTVTDQPEVTIPLKASVAATVSLWVF
jgi:hypothetical protein